MDAVDAEERMRNKDLLAAMVAPAVATAFASELESMDYASRIEYLSNVSSDLARAIFSCDRPDDGECDRPVWWRSGEDT